MVAWVCRLNALLDMQELLVVCPQLQQHPEWLVAAMTNLLVNTEAMLSLNCVLYDHVSMDPGLTRRSKDLPEMLDNFKPTSSIASLLLCQMLWRFTSQVIDDEALASLSENVA